ncbi:MAG: hypothetical protein U5K79_07025 [Cyclobacteriaceae bacterium]|nr:hypothetical protein [Cyclobacteriaceae bacterium]
MPGAAGGIAAGNTDRGSTVKTLGQSRKRRKESAAVGAATVTRRSLFLPETLMVFRKAGPVDSFAVIECPGGGG